MYFIQSLRLVGVKQNRIELARRVWHCQPVRDCGAVKLTLCDHLWEARIVPG